MVVVDRLLHMRVSEAPRGEQMAASRDPSGASGRQWGPSVWSLWSSHLISRTLPNMRVSFPCISSFSFEDVFLSLSVLIRLSFSVGLTIASPVWPSVGPGASQRRLRRSLRPFPFRGPALSSAQERLKLPSPASARLPRASPADPDDGRGRRHAGGTLSSTTPRPEPPGAYMTATSEPYGENLLMGNIP
jgi:hypothetical protein